MIGRFVAKRERFSHFRLLDKPDGVWHDAGSAERREQGMKVGDQVVYRYGERQPYVSQSDPGVITEIWTERDTTWARVTFTVEDWRPVSGYQEWCETCRNLGGWWECAELGRNCYRCRCEAEHIRVRCPERCVTAIDNEEEDAMIAKAQNDD